LGRKLVTIVIMYSLSLWLVDRMTLVISGSFTTSLCGELHLGSIGSLVGRTSCGHELGKYMVVMLFILLLLGKVVMMIPGVNNDRLERREGKS